MNQERKEELIVRWMDDDVLTSTENEELTQILEAEPELKALRDENLQVRKELQAEFGQPGDVPYGDFFQTKLEQAIRDSDKEDVTPAAKSSSSWRESLRWWLAPVAVGAMAVAFLAGTRVGKAPVENRLVVKSAEERLLVYTPEGGVSSTIVNADAEGTSVIVLDGLQPIPDSHDLMASSKRNPDSLGATRLISVKATPRGY